MTIQPGDTVQLKGSAFKMVVSHLEPDGKSARVCWLNVVGDGATAKNATFPLALLERANRLSEPFKESPYTRF